MTVQPTFLHRSFQHETLIKPCGFTNIAVVHASASAGVSTVGNAVANVDNGSKRRWLIFVDKKRGILGRTVVACPAQEDPPPGRRRSHNLVSRSTPGTSGRFISGREAAFLSGAVHLPLASDDRQNLVQSTTVAPGAQSQRPSELILHACRDDNYPRVRRSLPLLTDGAAGNAGTAALSALVEEVNTGGLGKHNAGKGALSPKPVRSAIIDDGRRDVRGCVPGGQSPGANSEGAEKTGGSSVTAGIGGQNNGANVEILLDGLIKPSLVAAPARGSKGVVFIDQPPSAASTAEGSTAMAKVAEGLHYTCADSPTDCGHKGQKPQASSHFNVQTAAQSWQLRFLRWGAGEAITLIENLYNPIALCVGTSDSSVFVLEEVQTKRRPLHRRKKRYRVSRLEGSRFSEWSDRGETKELLAASANQGAKIRNHKNPVGVSAGGLTCPDIESETDWDSSSTNTASSGSVEHGDQNTGGSSIEACTVKEASRRSTSQPRLRRSVKELVEVLNFSSSSALRRDFHRPSEHPVDMCVLRDGTIIIAYSRAAPLHDGVSIAESQGVLRTFPAHDNAGTPGRSGAREASSLDAMEMTVPETSAKLSEPSVYSDDDGWLVAEGLPVITGLVAGGGDAVYLSLCGARHDGAVTAIGSLSTRRPRPLRVDTRREDFRGRTKIERAAKQVGDEACANTGDNSDGAHGRGQFVRVASGYAAALTVDDKMNLFYITAESNGTCCALWCSVPGASNRRVSSLRGSSPTVRVTTAGVSLTTTRVPADSAERAGEVAEQTACDGKRLRSCGGHMEGEHGAKNGCRVDWKEKVQARTTAAATAATVEKETKRAIALSMELVEDDEANFTSRTSATHLFASRHRSGGSEQAGGLTAAGEGKQDNGGGIGMEGSHEDSDEPVNIAVVSRCRPLLARETKRGVRAAVFCDGDEIVVPDEALPERSRRFGFDRVFGPGTSQARVYAETVCPVVRKMLDGFNCSVLAYGQTGSGKTFTMEGGLVDPTVGCSEFVDSSKDDSTNACEVEEIGIIPRAVHTIFREGSGGGARRYWVYVSHMEIYNERLFDLLAPEVDTTNSTKGRIPSPRPSSSSCRSGRSPTHRSPRIITGGGECDDRHLRQRSERFPHDKASLSRKSTPRKSSPDGCESGGMSGGRGMGLTIEEDRHLGVVVKGLTQVEVKSPEEIFAIIARSKSTRRTAETMCNVESSRSHGVFCVRVISAEPMPWGGEITRDGRLSLVDLSGSENIKRSGAVGDRAKEAAAIGQSLLALGRVIKALVQHAPHVLYRESKLTRVLGDSLGGNAFTTIILNITPNNGMLDETLNTLAYAKTAQSVRNTPKQRITNKAPTDEATAGGGKANPREPETTGLSCNMASELRRWRGGAESRSLSSGSRRGAHVRPWESGVPIRAPSTSSSNVVHPSKETTFDQPGNDQRISRRNNASKLRKGNGRRRPATEGGFRTSLRARAGDSSIGIIGRTSDSYAHPRLSVGGVSASQTPPRRELGDGAARASATAMPATLIPSASEQGLTSTSHGDHPSEQIEVREFRLLVPSAGERALRSEKEAATKVFDSTAAEWVHTVVLQREAGLHESASYRARHSPVQPAEAPRVRTGNSAPAAKDVGSLKLTAAAKRAVEDVFDRYVHDAPGRRFLLSAEIAALQEIWTRPDAEPPPPRLAKSSSDLLLRHPRSKAPQRRTASFLDHGSAAGGSPDMLASADSRDRRVLSRDAFVEFCRQAAARDAIFVRYFFVRTGYDHRLELPSLSSRDGTIETRATTGLSVSASSSPRPKKASVSSDGRISRCIVTSGRIGVKEAVGRDGRRESGEERGRSSRKGSRRDGNIDGGSGGGGVEVQKAFFASRSERRELAGYKNHGDQSLTTGGLVDAAELWLWTEDERDHGERQRMNGLLSRGGGAHISRAAAASIVGAFSGERGQSRREYDTPPHDNDRVATLHAVGAA